MGMSMNKKYLILAAIGILLSLVVIVILISIPSTLGSLLFPSEHCPDLGMKKALGLVSPTALCL